MGIDIKKGSHNSAADDDVEIIIDNGKVIIEDKVIDNKYADNYSNKKFWHKVKSTVKHTGLKLIYKALQLYYVTENPNCPKRVKVAIFAALGYFISPLDAIADFIPFAGYTDDTGIIAAALIIAQFYIDETVKQKAKNKIAKIFGENALAELD